MGTVSGTEAHAAWVLHPQAKHTHLAQEVEKLQEDPGEAGAVTGLDANELSQQIKDMFELKMAAAASCPSSKLPQQTLVFWAFLVRYI